MEVISQRIHDYMAQRLKMDEDTIQTLRSRYVGLYGTTMRGLILEHGVDAEDYLHYVHDFPVEQFLVRSDRLDQVLEELPWQKVIFTSSTREHAHLVLGALGVERHFPRVYDIRDTGYVGKPAGSAFRTLFDGIHAEPQQCVLLDDSVANLRAASELGMATVGVGCQEGAEGVDWCVERVEDVLGLFESLVKALCPGDEGLSTTIHRRAND